MLPEVRNMHWGSHLGHSSIPLMGIFKPNATLVLGALLVATAFSLAQSELAVVQWEQQ